LKSPKILNIFGPQILLRRAPLFLDRDY